MTGLANQMSTFPRPNQRSGMSLMEVLVALAIFLSALIVLGQLVIMGGERAQKVQDLSRATELCQSKLAEVVAGVVPLNSQSNAPFDEDPQWLWSLDCSQGDVANLWDVSVRVSRERPDGPSVECSLSQKVLDPSVRGNALDAVLTTPAPSTNGSNNASGVSSTGSSSATSSSPTAGASGAGGAKSSAASSKSAAPSASSSGTSASKAATKSSTGSK